MQTDEFDSVVTGILELDEGRVVDFNRERSIILDHGDFGPFRWFGFYRYTLRRRSLGSADRFDP